VNTTAWSKGLDVTGGGRGIVSHAGVVLLRALADRTGLTGGLSGALARRGFVPVHDRGRVLADLAVAIADGASVINDFAVLAGQREVLGPVASGSAPDPARRPAPAGASVSRHVSWSPDGCFSA